MSEARGRGGADQASMDGVLAGGRTLIAAATKSPGAAAEETTIARYRALVVLASRGPHRKVALAEALEVAPSTAGRDVRPAGPQGQVRRSSTRSDRRAVLVSLTPRVRRCWTRPRCGAGSSTAPKAPRASRPFPRQPPTKEGRQR